MSANWGDTFRGAFGSIATAGADLIRAKANEAAGQNNAPVTPTQSRIQPYMLWGGIAVVVVLVALVLRRR
jgi:hypothetical protein